MPARLLVLQVLSSCRNAANIEPVGSSPPKYVALCFKEMWGSGETVSLPPQVIKSVRAEKLGKLEWSEIRGDLETE